MLTTKEVINEKFTFGESTNLDELINMLETKPEYTIDDIEAANLVVNLNKGTPNLYTINLTLNGEPRKPPVAMKTCNTCMETFKVAAPTKKCNHNNCNGKLNLIQKKIKELKRPAPKCNKFCSSCNITFENVPTAFRKCQKCSNLLERVSNY